MENISQWIGQQEQDLIKREKVLQDDIQDILNRDDRLARTDCIKAQIELLLIIRGQRIMLHRITEALNKIKANLTENL